MTISDYNHTVQQYVFENWIDTPLDFEYMVEIVSVQFFKNRISVREACKFAKLIIDVETKSEFDYDLEYEPFKVLENGVDEQFIYEYDNSVNFESFEIILDGEKRIDIHYSEDLDFEGLVNKISKLDEPII